MNAKDKAKELVKKYSFCITTYKGTSIMGNEIAKQCALICTKELKEAANAGYDYDAESEIPFFNEVEQEINKM